MARTTGRGDEAKGRVKEAAGALADDPALKREGRADQAAGKLKQTANALIDGARRLFTRRPRRAKSGPADRM